MKGMLGGAVLGKVFGHYKQTYWTKGSYWPLKIPQNLVSNSTRAFFGSLVGGVIGTTVGLAGGILGSIFVNPLKGNFGRGSAEGHSKSLRLTEKQGTVTNSYNNSNYDQSHKMTPHKYDQSVLRLRFQK